MLCVEHHVTTCATVWHPVFGSADWPFPVHCRASALVTSGLVCFVHLCVCQRARCPAFNKGEAVFWNLAKLSNLVTVNDGVSLREPWQGCTGLPPRAAASCSVCSQQCLFPPQLVDSKPSTLTEHSCSCSLDHWLAEPMVEHLHCYTDDQSQQAY
jgi:hypothetical protein